MIAIIAEKPSVARDIARVIGATTKDQHSIRGNGYIVTWAFGHLVTLAEPKEINPAWSAWRHNLLPMIPDQWKLTVVKKVQGQFNAIKKIINSRDVTSLICATDAGREGELIFRYIYKLAGCRKPFKRLWISSLTTDAIRKGFANLKPGNKYDPLADAAHGRSQADWLVGLNLTRLYSIGQPDLCSVGRVQTPTLALIVDREKAIRNFVPESYIEIDGTFESINSKVETGKISQYTGTWFRNSDNRTGIPKKGFLEQAKRLPEDGKEAAIIIKRVKSGMAQIEEASTKPRKMPAPFLYDLTELQRHGNRLYGFSAQKTLNLAQTLYETKKLITYPRTDSRRLTSDMEETLPGVVNTITEQYGDLFPYSPDQLEPLGIRYINDKMVTDHHAIIPTAVNPARVSLSDDEAKIYDMICRRLLSAWMNDYITQNTTVITMVTSTSVVDRFHSTGVAIEQIGWKAMDIKLPGKARKSVSSGKGSVEGSDKMLPPGLKKGRNLSVIKAERKKKKTKPPQRFNEATILTAMETAGKTLDDKALSDAMKANGLGTPATRAAILETLIKRNYISRKGKSLEATEKGIEIIDVVHPHVKSPEMTGEWENKLKQIEKGNGNLDDFMRGIEQFIRDVVRNKRTILPSAQKQGPAEFTEDNTNPVITTQDNPVSTDVVVSDVGLKKILKTRFGFDDFRPYQANVCEVVAKGSDVLLVMPTGSGKSLCYQLPGIARGGTTLVISPLIALMEDQVLKLQEMNFRAERIHSGRDRMVSRQVCREYLQGQLDFLFIAPERLSVPGFPEMLAKRKPTLIAVDEAHCISQWGHDFRPDYRLLGQRLPILRPTPVIGLTATATPRVQQDIVQQLGMLEHRPFIHGFRRTNIAIEIVEMPPSRRIDMTLTILKDASKRPAIVYCSTRKKTEETADSINMHFPAMAYHAGLTSKKRDMVQKAFIDGSINVIVATIAFGMGIDKPNIRTVIHTGLPGTLEGYYQEIGRAGRDDKKSRAILFYSYADRHLHLFLHEKNYPDERVMQNLFTNLPKVDQQRDVIRKKTDISEDLFDVAIEKLWLHGGALVDPDDNIRRGDPNWINTYSEQKAHGLAQLDEITRFAGSSTCRMIQFITHFGDRDDKIGKCGICDICAPCEAVAGIFRTPGENEITVVEEIVAG
ncbi:DNA topoisomerase 3 [bacterium]|nr:DNA topoisomerase 3 [bacterium]